MWIIAIIAVVAFIIVMKRQTDTPSTQHNSTSQPYQTVRPTRNFPKEELTSFFEGISLELVVIDAETNGLDPQDSSVLSVAAIKYQLHQSLLIDEVSRYERYYFPKEPFNSRAVAINGLSKEVLLQKRMNVQYPEYFADDPELKAFMKGITHVIGHNISFDAGFIPMLKTRKKLCTMKSNTNVVAIPKDNGYGYKWPTLGETALHYGVPYDPDNAHAAMYDVMVTAGIFKNMLLRAEVKITITET